VSEAQLVTAAEVAAARTERKSLIKTFSARLGLEPERMMSTLKATAFRVRGTEISDEQMAALLVVANQHDLNPFTKEIYAYPDKNGGIVPVIGVDGWLHIVNRHPQFNGMDFKESEEIVTLDGAKPCPAWIECTIHRKDREHPIVIREYLDEVYKPPFVKDGRTINGPWQTHTKRFLRWKTIIQAARVAFSFSGIYDEDEASNILAAEEAIDITPSKDGKLSPKKLREVIDGALAAVKAENGVELQKIWASLTSDEQLFVWGELRSWERSAIKKLLDASKNQAPEDIDPWAVECIKTATAQTLETTWRLVQDAYAERDREVPLDTETVYTDRKAELGL